MGSWAERMIAQEVVEKSRTEQKETALQSKIAQEKKHEASTLAIRLFHIRYIDSESFFRWIAYTYFVCRTLGLLILISVITLGRSNTIRFMFVYMAIAILNLIFYKLVLKKKIKGNI